ncbi:MAG: prepilin peptidase [Acidithiobacillus sp.]
MGWEEIGVALWAVWGAQGDYRRQRLPNSLTLSALALGLAVLPLTGRCFLGAPWGSALLGVAAAFLALLPAYVWRLVAAGDVKFFMAMGALGGVDVLFPVYLAAGVITLALVARDRLFTGMVQQQYPYGVGLGLGCALVVLSHWRLVLHWPVS